jgi:lipopolysaccharide biosynthesis regulator YciM
MAKIAIIFVVIFIVILSMLSFFNNSTVSLTLWHGLTYELPVMALILISTAVGIVSMLIIIACRDARRYFDSWHVQRQHKKESKIQESYSRALDALLAERHEEASDLFNRILEDEPSHVNSMLRLGDIALNQNDFANAKKMFERARESKPRSMEVLLSLVNVAECQERWPEALKYLDTVLDIDSNNPGILYRKKDIYERLGRWEEAIEVQEKILKSNISREEEEREQNNLLGLKCELARYHAKTGALEKAIKALKSIIKTNKDFISAYLALADLHLKNGEATLAGEVLKKGHEETSSLVFLIRLEDFYITMGEPGTIIDLYQKAVQRDQKNLKLQFFLAKLYYRLEMIDYAYDTINAIDIRAFDTHEYHMLLGSIYERRAQYEKSIDEFKKAMEIRKRIFVPYCCSQCTYTSKKWSDRCPECKRWNTLTLDINEACKIENRQSSS